MNEKSSKIRLDYLDGIRGWAALIVVFGHTMGGLIAINNPELVNHQWTYFFTNAHLAVLVFFVLSGYVLSVSVIYSSKRNLSVSVISRYFRLLIPILTISLIAYLFMKFGLFLNQEAANTDLAKSWLGRFFAFDESLLGAIKFSFYDVFFSYRDDKTYNSSLWTMPIEMFGSLLIYSYLSIFRSSKFIPLIGLSLTAYLYFNNVFMFCFMFGYMLAEIRRISDFKFEGIKDALLVLAFLAIAYIDTYHRPGDERLLVLEAVGVVTLVSYSGILSRIFSSRISRFLGRISFSLYLVQIVVICSLSSCLKIYFEQTSIDNNIASIVNLSVTLIVSILFARLLTPVDEWSSKASKRIASIFVNNSESLCQFFIKKPL